MAVARAPAAEDTGSEGLSSEPTLGIYKAQLSKPYTLPIGPEVVPFCGLYLESYKVIPHKNRNYYGASG